MHNARWDTRTVSVSYDLSSIRLDWYLGGIVAFVARHQHRDWVQCTIDTRGTPWATVCSGTYTGPAPQPPPPPPPSWSAQPQVIEACDRAFVGSAFERACLDAVARARYNPADAIAACDRAIVGDGDTLACVRNAGAASFNPSAAIAACDTAIVGDAATAACAAAVAAFAADPSATVRACDAANVGDDDTVACIRRASGMR